MTAHQRLALVAAGIEIVSHTYRTVEFRLGDSFATYDSKWKTWMYADRNPRHWLVRDAVLAAGVDPSTWQWHR